MILFTTLKLCFKLSLLIINLISNFDLLIILQAIQAINDKVAVKNPKVTLFDVIMMAKNLQGIQTKIENSIKYYGNNCRSNHTFVYVN